jgi:hypothetical protein
MRRLADRPVTAVAATRPRVARSVYLLALVILTAALVAIVIARSSAPRHAANDSAARPRRQADRASQPWFMPEPTPLIVGKSLDRPAKTKAASPEPDWSAFSLGVSDAQASIAVPRTGNEASSPAEIQVALSSVERARLIAAARCRKRRHARRLPSTSAGCIPAAAATASAASRTSSSSFLRE